MSTNIEILGDHDGILHLFVEGQVASGAEVSNFSKNGANELCAVVVIPLKYVTLGQVKNVIPLIRPQR